MAFPLVEDLNDVPVGRAVGHLKNICSGRQNLARYLDWLAEREDNLLVHSSAVA